MPRKKAKAKKPLSYKGVTFPPETVTFLKEVRIELVKKGCFFSYKDIARMLLQHVYYNIFYKHDPAFKYPCDKRFHAAVKNKIFFDEGSYYFNGVKDKVDDLVFQYGADLRYYTRDFKGIINRHKNLVSFMVALDHYLSVIWDGIDEAGYNGDIDTSSPGSPDVFTIDLTFEKYTKILLVDFTTFMPAAESKTVLMEYFKLLQDID